MQVSVESSEGLERRMKVELPAEKVDAEIEGRLKEIARSARLDGFRPGKVPLSVVRKRFAAQVRQEVFERMVQSSYFEALAHEKLQPAGEPSIEPLPPVDSGDMGYMAVFEVMPEVELNDLGAMTIKRQQAQVGDQDLEAMIDKLRRQRTTWNPVEREAREGDQLTINFKGFMDGEAFEGGSAEEVPLVLGSGSMIDGFETGLLGVNAGDNRTLELEFPEKYQVEKLAGKPATFEVEVVKVAEPVMPEVDEEFAKAFGVADGGVEQLYKEIRANMQRELADKIQAAVKDQAMDTLLQANPLDVPKILVKKESQSLQRQTKDNMARSGQSSKLDLPLELFEEQARRRVALGLIIGEVIRQNNITVDAARVRHKIEELAQSYEDPQEVVDYYYSNKQQLASVENVVLEDQVVDWVVAQVQVEDVASGFDDVMNPPAQESQSAE